MDSVHPAPYGFDFATAYHGRGARLVHPGGHTVILTEGPVTLLALLRLHVLSGAALAEARKIAARGMEVLYL